MEEKSINMEDVKEYLRKNLSVRVEVSSGRYYGAGLHVKAILLLENQTISEDSDYISE